MIFSAFITAFLLSLVVYALLQKKDFPIVGRALPAVCLLGIFAAWFPERTSMAAEWVGVGRGVDLMLYVWMLASGLLILVLHLKLVSHERRLTELVRFVAIASTTPPAPADVGTGGQSTQGALIP